MVIDVLILQGIDKMPDLTFQCDICNNKIDEDQACRTVNEYNCVICSECVEEIKENKKRRRFYNKICSD
jgi:hypothetical protein